MGSKPIAEAYLHSEFKSGMWHTPQTLLKHPYWSSFHWEMLSQLNWNFISVWDGVGGGFVPEKHQPEHTEMDKTAPSPWHPSGKFPFSL